MTGQHASRLLALALSLLLCACGKRTDISPGKMNASQEAMWQRIGRTLAEQCAPAGEERLLLVRGQPAPEQDAIEAALRAHLGARRTIAVAALPDAPRPRELDESYPLQPIPLTAAWLAAQVKSAGPLGGIVSLVGEPVQPPAAAPPLPPIVCFAPLGTSNLAAWISSGKVKAAVAPRHDAPPADEKEWFQLRYTVLDAARVGTW